MTTSKIISGPLNYDISDVLKIKNCVTLGELKSLYPRLEKARDESLADIELWASGGEIPKAKDPLDAGFINVPDDLLKEYRANGEASELGQIQSVAKKIAENFDRVVVLGIGGSYMGARALMEACCHSYHNELSREHRSNTPRMYFDGNNMDNDALQHLLDIVVRNKGVDESGKCAIVVISKSGGTLETAGAFRQFLSVLGEDAIGCIYPVTGPEGKLRELAKELGCKDVFNIADGVGGRFSILTAVGLLPAAILGLDVEKLLQGAAEMNEHFRTAAAADNVVLNYVGLNHLAEENYGMDIRLLSTWGKKLEAAGLWYDQLLSESLGKAGKGALPLTVVNTRDLHSRGQQHQEGARDKIVMNLVVGENKEKDLKIEESALNQDQLNKLAGKRYSDLLNAAIAGTNTAYRDDNRPTTTLTLPKLDERSMGKFFQMMMLATVVEGRLIGINPYGQPGVESYKVNMNQELQK